MQDPVTYMQVKEIYTNIYIWNKLFQLLLERLNQGRWKGQDLGRIRETNSYRNLVRNPKHMRPTEKPMHVAT
jgi:DNA primase catalytic subunit